MGNSSSEQIEGTCEPKNADPQAAFEENLKRIFSLPKDKIEEYEREHKPFAKSRAKKPAK